MLGVHDFQYVADLVRQRSGIVLSAEKGYLIESRLTPVARDHGHSSLAELVATIRRGNANGLLEQVTEAMTTNETFFFRDKKPFDIFEAFVLPEMIKRRGARGSLKIWSAACSSGQEVYSLAMLMDQKAAQMRNWRADYLATDLSRDILDKAEAGVYSQFEVQRGLPIQLLVKYFEQIGDTWRISEDIRRKVRFQPLNLLTDFTGLGKFDIVFCRNVLIYFDEETKSAILTRLRKVIADDGFLFLGGAETLLGLVKCFKPVPSQRGVYEPA